jgi:hypothetical protein
VFREAPVPLDCPPAPSPEGHAPLAGRLGERDLLSSVCHDLKAPLASMTMGVAFLRRVLPKNDDPTSRVVDALHRASHRMSRTIASFSDLAKLQMGELELDARMTPVGDIMKATYDTFLPEARADRIPLVLEVDAATAGASVPCDQARVVQTLWQLFVCARHVLPGAAQMVLRARPGAADGAVCVELEATVPSGGGRAPSETMPTPELTIARGLIALHGGCLDVAVDAERVKLSFSLSTSTDAGAGRGSPRERVDGN